MHFRFWNRTRRRHITEKGTSLLENTTLETEFTRFVSRKTAFHAMLRPIVNLWFFLVNWIGASLPEPIEFFLMPARYLLTGNVDISLSVPPWVVGNQERACG